MSRAVHTICLLSSVWGAHWTKWNTRSAVSVSNSTEATGWNTRDVLFFRQELMCNSVTLLWSLWRAAGGQFVLETQKLGVRLRFRLRLLFSSAAANNKRKGWFCALKIKKKKQPENDFYISFYFIVCFVKVFCLTSVRLSKKTSYRQLKTSYVVCATFIWERHQLNIGWSWWRSPDFTSSATISLMFEVLSFKLVHINGDHGKQCTG